MDPDVTSHNLGEPGFPGGTTTSGPVPKLADPTDGPADSISWL
jgi:hypothetical protein